jgi:transposase
MLTGLGLELTGRAGARLAGRLGIAVHSSTILRLLAALPEREAGTASDILGIDDFSLLKGHVYGTVLVDMETGDVVDMLPDRESATVEAWLKAHPGAAVICRDRATGYGEAATSTGHPLPAQTLHPCTRCVRLPPWPGKCRHYCCMRSSECRPRCLQELG